MITELSKADLLSQRVLVRVDFNVPLSDDQVRDDTRIRAALPTIQHLINQNAKVILMSHLGRPDGQVSEKFRLAPVAQRLSSLLDRPVLALSDCIGPEVRTAVQQMADGDVILLENIRFYEEETANDAGFAKELASLADLFVQDAFGVVHRAHASTLGVTQYLPSYSGFLVNRELSFLSQTLKRPDRPFVAVVGGAKVSSKIGVLRHLLASVDQMVIGGGMAYTFLLAKGHRIGGSLVERDKLEVAASFLAQAEEKGVQVILPDDHGVVSRFDDPSGFVMTDGVDIDGEWIGVDVGPKSIERISGVIASAKCILWNGPLGVFEVPAFATGTMALAKMVAESEATSIVGGGDSVAAVNQSGLADQMTHVSTGGGASLAFLEGSPLPGIEGLRRG